MDHFLPVVDIGNTPTCVGKTESEVKRAAGLRKHPHVRGEDRLNGKMSADEKETPPRAWGRHAEVILVLGEQRNTPTCVGKTIAVVEQRGAVAKHPHVRGEDPDVSAVLCAEGETPPRAWGRLLSLTVILVPPGNTPTCVGKTPVTARLTELFQKHPHVRGEDLLLVSYQDRA